MFPHLSMSSVRFITGGSRKEAEVVFCDGFKFTFHKSLAGGVRRWWCSARGGQTKCGSYLKTDGHEVIYHSTHNHEPTESEDSCQLRAAVKRKVADNAFSARPSKVVRSALTDLPHINVTNSGLNNLQRLAYRKNRQRTPSHTSGGTIDPIKKPTGEEEAVSAMIGPSRDDLHDEYEYGEVKMEPINVDEGYIEQTPDERTDMYGYSGRPDFFTQGLTENEEHGRRVHSGPPAHFLCSPDTCTCMQEVAEAGCSGVSEAVEKSSWKVGDKRHRPLTHTHKDADSLTAAQTELAKMTAEQLQKDNLRKDELHQLEVKNKIQLHAVEMKRMKLEAELLELQILKMKKELGIGTSSR